MKFFNHNRKYSLLTLRPHNEEDRKLFFEFRADDVIEMFNYRLGMEFCFWFSILVQYMFKFDDKDMRNKLYFRSVYFIMHVVVFFLGLRFKRNIIYMIPALYTIAQLINIMEVKDLMSREIIEGDDIYLYDSLPIYRMIFNFCVCSVLLCPSFLFIGFNFLPTIMGGLYGCYQGLSY